VAAAAIGNVLEWTGSNYDPLLFACGFAYLFALLVIHLLAPRLDPTRVETAASAAPRRATLGKVPPITRPGVAEPFEVKR
jgi:hypothetical protein